MLIIKMVFERVKMTFGRKKIERPKNYLGYILFRYDNIINLKLKSIINAIKSKKRVNWKKADRIIEDVSHDLDILLDELSRENFKTDYRSDKIRDLSIETISGLKQYLDAAKKYSYDPDKIENDPLIISIGDLMGKRQELKKRMKDIESDYV